jgi:hypothetical protein
MRIFTDKNSLDHFRHGQIDFAARLVARARPGRINPVLGRPAASPAGLTRGSIFFASKLSCEKDGLHQSRMFSTLVILNAPKSGTPDFGVKPGNDGGNRGTSVLHPFDRDFL